MKPDVEEFARRMHGYWARRRLDQGVQYGPTRTDTTHPGIVDDWSDLPADERQFDLGFASDVLQCLDEMGFQVVKKRPRPTV